MRAGVLLLALCLPSLAEAHQASISYSDITVHGPRVVWQLAIGDTELGVPAGLGERTPERAELAALERPILDYVVPRLVVKRGDVACRLEGRTLHARPRSLGVFGVVTATYDCPVDPRGGLLRFEYALFFDLDPRHQSVVALDVDGTPVAAVLDAANRTLHVAGADGKVKLLYYFLGLGVEHILTGFDHLAFLLALLLVLLLVPDGLTRDGLRTITAFTVAHSITLLLAAFGVLRLPSYWVESAIALSIVVVALGSLRRGPPRARWLVTFAFGLVHGLGFASVLGESRLARDTVVGSVVCFNLGVELGQVGVLLALLPLLLWLRRRDERLRRRVVDVASLILALLGVGWLVLRLRG